ncbi:MalY/PatB family protein [Peribacillus sp. SCS-155]|uniref:MalY/PatB family protein n=1 Tax=Peribacillus sedimenti TaxID=3115297 RepID=UPI0039060665
MDSRYIEEIFERRNTGSVKWDYTDKFFSDKDLLPMWVADMDFPSPEPVQRALTERIKHPLFGYTGAPQSLYESIINWMNKHHSWEIDKQWILFSHGVVASLATAIQALTSPGDQILLQSPVYTPFFDMIKSNERLVVNSELLLQNNRYMMDFEDIEKKLQGGVKLFLLCNPQNPSGRIWTKKELNTLGELCLHYGVKIVSDEIHADLYLHSHKHTPIASLDERFSEITVTLAAPSKTFNLAGLQSSFIIAANGEIRKKLEEVQNRNAFHGLNLLALTAMEAAYSHGEEWLSQVILYLEENIKISLQFIEENLPQIKCIEPEASYLLWLDCRNLGLTDAELRRALIKKGKIAVEPGNKYGPGGEGFIRLNIGCPRPILMDGLNRLKLALG